MKITTLTLDVAVADGYVFAVLPLEDDLGGGVAIGGASQLDRRVLVDFHVGAGLLVQDVGRHCEREKGG